MRKNCTSWASALMALLVVAGGVAAADPTPTSFRGDGTGRFDLPEIPMEWTTDPPKNILWKTPLPQWSNASPVFADDNMFVCAEPDTLVCLNAKTGEVIWQKASPVAEAISAEEAARRAAVLKEYEPVLREMREAEKVQRDADRAWRQDRDNAELRTAREEANNKLREIRDRLRPWYEVRTPVTHGTNGYASPTPATDGKSVFVLYATGVAAAYTPEGERLWIREVERPQHGWGHSSSPTIVDDKVIVAIIDIHALDPATGETLWRAPSKAHWGTPVGASIGGSPVIITCEGQILDAKDGRELSKELPSLMWNTPLVQNGIVYTYDQKRGAEAHKLPETLDGKPVQLWQTKVKSDRHYSSPVLIDGLLYCCNQKGVLSVVRADSGELVYEKQLDLGRGTYYPSPTIMGSYVYVTCENGTTVVLEPGPEYKEVARNSLDPFRTSPVVHNGRIYIRTLKAAYCIGR